MSDSRSRPLVIVWPHEQQQAEVLDRQHAPAPPAGTERPERVYLDPVWTAIGLPKTAKGTAWVSGYGEVITALELQRLVVEANPSPGHPLPDLRHRQWGEIFRPRGKRYDLLRPTVSLNSDGPTIPALRMVDRLIKEFAPSLIVSIGLGGGVNDDDQVGDVVVATHGKFDLPDEYRTFDGSDRTFGCELEIDRTWFADPPQEQGLRLLPASRSYEEPPGGWPQPAPHQPRIRVERVKPVITRPSLTGPSFRPAGPRTMWNFQRGSNSWIRGANRDFLGDDAAAVDMDYAVVARACQEAGVPSVGVVGVCVPALDAQPFAADVRRAWAITYQRQFGQSAANNAVAVAETLIDKLTTDQVSSGDP